MEDPRIISALFIFLKMAYYNVLINTYCVSDYVLAYIDYSIFFESFIDSLKNTFP